MRNKPDFFEWGSRPKALDIFKAFACALLECLLWTLLYSTYTETINILSDTYLSELPLLGGLFGLIDDEANASHVISGLLALFCVATPLWLFNEIYAQRIMDNPQAWFAERQNQVFLGLFFFLVVLVVGIEISNLLTLIIQTEAESNAFDVGEATGLEAAFADNKGMAVGASIIVAVVNFTLAFLSVKTFRSLGSSSENS